MKLFIYYSLTGNGDLVADYLKGKGYEIRKIEVKKPLPSNFVLQILTGGFKAAINYKEKLIDFNNDISKYDEIVIGSPIWNARLSTPVSTALKELDLTNKKTRFILYSGSGTSPKATEFINKNYKDSKIIDLKQPIANKKELNKIEDI